MAREEGVNFWTSTQQRTLLLLVSVFVVVLIGKATLNRQYIANPQPPQPSLANQLADRLDPNTATAGELVILPQLGEKRANEIIAFRERYLRQHPNDFPFKRPEDLLQINGIGAATLETLRPHLTFPTTAPSSL